MLRSIVFVLGVALIGLLAGPAIAQPACGERAKFMNKLEQTFAEHPVAMGLTSKGAVLEVFASNNGSWTFLITMPDGLSCVVDTGQGWETLAKAQTDQTS